MTCTVTQFGWNMCYRKKLHQTVIFWVLSPPPQYRPRGAPPGQIFTWVLLAPTHEQTCDQVWVNYVLQKKLRTIVTFLLFFPTPGQPQGSTPGQPQGSTPGRKSHEYWHLLLSYTVTRFGWNICYRKKVTPNIRVKVPYTLYNPIFDFYLYTQIEVSPLLTIPISAIFQKGL